MPAKIILHTKQIKEDEIVEIKIWQLPESKSRTHQVKFSIAYVKNGKRLIGYDNAEGKGFHRHVGGKEETYNFVNIGKLLEDFRRYLTRERGKDWDED